MIGSGMVVRSLPYKEGFGAKQIAWMVHSGIVGAVIAPLTLLGGPLMIRAACYTAGVVGGKFSNQVLLWLEMDFLCKREYEFSRNSIKFLYFRYVNMMEL